MAIKSFPSKKRDKPQTQFLKTNTRACPSCGLPTIRGMPGGRDALCRNCGFKDPCCYD